MNAKNTTTHLGRDPRGPAQPMILVHIAWCATDCARAELARAEVMDEAEGRDDEQGGAGELTAAIGCWVVPAW